MQSYTDIEYQISSNVEQLAELILDIYRWEREMVKRLSETPGGFSFEGQGRSCSVCLNAGSSQMWYDRDGMRCMDCQCAYLEKVIPRYVIQKNSGRKYITESFFCSKTGESLKSVQGMIKSGRLKSRVIKHSHARDTVLLLKSDNPALKYLFA